MTGNSLTARWNTILSIVLGLMAAFVVIAVLTGTKVPFVSGETANFIALAAIGVAACVAGNSHSATRFGWTSPISIIGMVLGVAALLLITFTLIGINIPFTTGYTIPFTVLAVIIFLKVGLKILQNTVVK